MGDNEVVVNAGNCAGDSGINKCGEIEKSYPSLGATKASAQSIKSDVVWITVARIAQPIRARGTVS